MGRVFCLLVLQCWFPGLDRVVPRYQEGFWACPTFQFPSCEVFGSARASQIGNLWSWGWTHPQFMSKPHFLLCTAGHDQTQQLLPPFRNQSLAFLEIGRELSGFEALFQHLSTICRIFFFFLIRCMRTRFVFEVELLKRACH